MKFSKTNINYLLSTSLLIFAGLISFIIEKPVYLSIFTTVINILFILKFYNKIPVLFLFVFIYFYTRTFNYFFLDNILISHWSDFQNQTSLSKVLLCHAFFIYFMGNFISIDKYSNVNYDFRHFFQPNNKLFHILLFVALFFLFFGLTGQTLLSGTAYADSELTHKSTMHEYFILVFFFLILFSKKQNKNILITLLFIYVIKTLLYGSRIEVVEILLLWFYLFYYFNDKIKKRAILLLLIAGIYFTNVMSNVRSNPIGFLSGNDLITYFDPSNMFVNNTNTLIISSNEGDVIQSSSRIIGLIDKGELNLFQRLSGFVIYLSTPIIPTSFLPDYSNLSSYKQDIYKSGGGGLISVYFYTWLGFLGPMLIGIIIALLVNNFFLGKSIYYYVYGVTLFVTFPRWFSYNPIMLIKFCLYSIFILFLVKLFFKPKLITGNI